MLPNRFTIVALALIPCLSPAIAQTTAPADTELTFTFPENVELRVLIDYVGERLGVQFLYEDVVGQQRITIRQGARVPRAGLLNFLQLILQSKGFSLADMNQPGWKKIVPATAIANDARPTTAPAAGLPAVGAVTQVFVLKSVDAARMDATIKPFLTQPGATSIAIPEQRMLVVTDYASNMPRLAQLVALLDQQAKDIAVEFVPLEHGDAEEIQSKVAQVLTATLTTQGPSAANQGDKVEVGFDKRTNQIALIGHREAVMAAIRVVRQFDLPASMVSRAYSFQHIDPERVDKLIRDLLDPSAVKRSYQSAIDRESGLMFVSATPAVLKQIDSLKQSLDVAIVHKESPVQFYKLANTTAVDVLTTIRGIQTGGEGDSSDEPLSRGPLGRETSNRRSTSLSERNASGSMAMSDRRSRTGSRPASAGGPTSRPAALGTASFQATDATVTADPNTNSIIVVSEPAIQKVYEQLIRTLDKRRPQVLIECTLVQIDTSKNFVLGVDIGIQGGSGSADIISFSSFGIGRPQTTDGPGSPANGRLALIPGAAGFNGALLNADVADIVINALQTNRNAKVISAPRILVNDNATGMLESTSEQPFTSVNIGDTVSTTSFVDYAKAGTTIEVTPHISEANYLQLRYTVELNKFTGQGVNGIPPPRQTNKLESVVTIPDGSTIIIGGLNSTNHNTTKNAIPLLGDIPVLEHLFSSRSVTDEQTTLFVFIRPVVLRDDQFNDLKYLSEKDTQRAGIRPDDPASVPMAMK